MPQNKLVRPVQNNVRALYPFYGKPERVRENPGEVKAVRQQASPNERAREAVAKDCQRRFHQFDMPVPSTEPQL